MNRADLYTDSAIAKESIGASWVSGLVFGLATLIGVAAFLYPFWLPAVQQGANMGMAHSQDAP